jgi:hypothetical protein
MDRKELNLDERVSQVSLLTTHPGLQGGYGGQLAEGFHQFSDNLQ